ncbi:MAG: succinate dehydrogenase hydrophobic membrane anchor subunit [Microbacteriaceae bacterium]|jgi:succinate dehydrogenase / fumarate reductase membrane anchor subunit
MNLSQRFKLDRLAWVFMRVSGFFLVFLIFTHLIVNVMQDGGVHAIDFAFVAGKLADPMWQWFDVSLLWLAVLHGTNGMRTIVDDYVYRVRLKKVLLGGLYGSTALLLVLGTLVLFTLDPCPAGSPADLLPSFCSAS